SHRLASGEGTFWFLLGPSKRDSHAQRAKALYLLGLLRSSLCDFDVPSKESTAGAKIKYRASALSRGLLLSWQK
ncbi:MAG: hypothetical protein ACTIJY_10805, partial [Luteimonas sp.]